MRLEHHLVGGYVRNISPHIIIIITYVCVRLTGIPAQMYQRRYILAGINFHLAAAPPCVPAHF